MVAPSAIREGHVGCAVCGKWFIGDEHFEWHRVQIAERVPPHRNDLRCMDDNELAAAGFKRTRKGLWFRDTRSHQRKTRT